MQLNKRRVGKMFVLYVLLMVSGTQVVNLGAYRSLAACEAASDWVWNKVEKGGFGSPPELRCLPTGEAPGK